jgi:hypothetical protein
MQVHVYYIKTQVKFNFHSNQLIIDRVMPLFKQIFFEIIGFHEIIVLLKDFNDCVYIWYVSMLRLSLVLAAINILLKKLCPFNTNFL